MRDNPEHISRELTRFTERQIVSLVLQVTAELTRDTPIDTGWASVNWLPNLDRPLTRPAGAREGVTSAVQGAGEAQVASRYRLPGTVHITNNVPYIEDLNDGFSDQAPEGFVEKAMERAIAIVEARRSNV